MPDVKLDRAIFGVNESVYYVLPGENPWSLTDRHEEQLGTNEQVWDRKTVATPEWKPLDFGWVNKPHEIIIVNMEGRFTQTMPSQEEWDEANSRGIEICFDASLLDFSQIGLAGVLILPRRSARFCPTSSDKLRIRCLKGQAKYRIIAIPSKE